MGRCLLITGSFAFLAACSARMPAKVGLATTDNAQTQPPVIEPATPLPEAFATATPRLVATNQPVRVTPSASFTPPVWAPVCSPLQGKSLAQLVELVVNPYQPPAPGSDDPHQGVDLADRAPNSQLARAGLPVLAALSGRVAGVIRNRFPYGNAILVETRLQDLPAEQRALWRLPTPGPTLTPRSALTCPTQMDLPDWDPSEHSIYLLYAHLQDDPILNRDDPVSCGDVLGAIGSSGNALNPHLHLEARLGPAGARFSSLSHYDTGASPSEMAQYCLWRISGWFQLLDPLQLLNASQ